MFAKVVTSSLRSSSRATACFTSTVRSMSSNSTSGRLYTWGSGGEGQLGYDVSTSDKTEVKGVSGSTQRVPRQVFLEDGTTPVWKQVQYLVQPVQDTVETSCKLVGNRLRVETLSHSA
jgi:alpha-tubulin suppressor-like RCC1 family protein